MSDRNAAVIAATLAACDAAVEADPLDASARERRAQFRALHGDDKLAAVADCRAALALRTGAGRLSFREAMRQGQSWLGRAQGNLVGRFRVYFGAQAVACFDAALARTTRPRRVLEQRAVGYAYLGAIAQAQADWQSVRALTGETAASWRAQAETLAAIRHAGSTDAYQQMIRVGARTRRWKLDGALCLRHARKNRGYEKAAWLNLAVEVAPADVEVWLARAEWDVPYGDRERAQADWQRAFDLEPDNPRIYEARAASDLQVGYYSRRAVWDKAVADYAHALHLRIASGELSGHTRELVERAKTLEDREGYLPASVEAFAVYGVAIERDAGAAMLYARRAALTHKLFYFEVATHQTALRAALEDNLHALQLNPKLVTPRTAIIAHYAHQLVGQSAHERLETLLQARQTLAQHGLKASFIARVIAEIEATPPAS